MLNWKASLSSLDLKYCLKTYKEDKQTSVKSARAQSVQGFLLFLNANAKFHMSIDKKGDKQSLTLFFVVETLSLLLLILVDLN